MFFVMAESGRVDRPSSHLPRSKLCCSIFCAVPKPNQYLLPFYDAPSPRGCPTRRVRCKRSLPNHVCLRAESGRSWSIDTRVCVVAGPDTGPVRSVTPTFSSSSIIIHVTSLFGRFTKRIVELCKCLRPTDRGFLVHATHLPSCSLSHSLSRFLANHITSDATRPASALEKDAIPARH